MFEEIKKPGVLKHIPGPLIRPLPCLYYFNKYRKSKKPEKVMRLFDSNINYLDEVLVLMSNKMDILQFKDITRLLYRLKKEGHTQYTLHFITAIEKLACICDFQRDKIKTFLKSNKTKLNEIYSTNIFKLKIGIINVLNDSEKNKKLRSILKNNCDYQVEIIEPNQSNYAEKIINSDVAILNATINPEVHALIDNLKTYNKPGIALVPLSGNESEDRIALRHGNQIRKRGFHVIYKSFTPIRMFTSIDREFLKYNLSGN